MSAQAARRRAERRADPVRHKLNTAQVLAPSVPIQPVRCECGHPGLMHRDEKCLTNGCGCTKWRPV